MELKIDNDVPIPIGKTHFFGTSAVLRKMKVGESVFIPEALHTAGSVSRICHGVLGAGNYIARKVEGGRRVWRTK